MPVTAFAAPATVAFVNGTGSALRNVQVRQLGKAWEPLAPGLSPGARTSATLSGDECAFDVRADSSGGTQIHWDRLNLCEVKSVTLNRRADGMSWADYD
jgi:hypothetical protein